MKKFGILFIVLCLLLCMIPSVGMLFFPTTETTENKAMAEFPQLIGADKKLNTAFSTEFEDYFNQHMALRNPLVYADATIQTALFRESNVSGVISGKNDWLYYSSTLSDHLGRDVMTARQCYNLAHNFAVVQQYLQERDIAFALTIPPNKNTLYSENMPYYADYQVSPEHSAILAAPYFAKQDVSYVNLFALFAQQSERLYLLRDSHWNNKGACLAYNAIMDALEKPHEDYAGVTPVLTNNTDGDLNRMLYSFYGDREENYDYGLAQQYVYTSSNPDVTAGWVTTENASAEGSLLMFRDSFADTLIPFLSNEFQYAYYSKGEPNALERYVETYHPDCVVMEKVERNIANYLDNPPILTAPEGQLPNNIVIAKTATTVQAALCENDPNYIRLSGILDRSRLQTNSEVLVRVNGTVYRAYQTGEDGFLLYLKKDVLTDTASAQVYICNGSICTQVLFTDLALS